ncbi:hypothetical protein IAT40_005423 [Kwoniella sp. CBS 6097]
MPFFQPTIYPNGSFTLHQPVQPPSMSPTPLPTITSRSAPAMPADEVYDEAPRCDGGGGGDRDGDRDGERPCVPSHRPCPGPIPPHDDHTHAITHTRIIPEEAYRALQPHMHFDPPEASRSQSRSAIQVPAAEPDNHLGPHPHAHSLNQGLPISHLAGAPSYSSQPLSRHPSHIQIHSQGHTHEPSLVPTDHAHCHGNNQRPPTASLPPSYKPLPSSAEDTLLLAPPPSFYASTCPFSHHYQSHTHTHAHAHAHAYAQTPSTPYTPRCHSRSSRRTNRRPSTSDPLLPVHSRPGSHTHSCPHCFDLHAAADDSIPDSPGRESDSMDLIVALLVLLNIVVWSAVIYGYIQEFANGGAGPSGEWNWPGFGHMLSIDTEAFKQFSISNACLGPAGGVGWGQICAGEDCRWAFVDC